MASPAAVLNILLKADTASATTSLSKFDTRLRGVDKTTASATTRTSALGSATKTTGARLASAARWAAGAAAAYVSIAQAKAAVSTTQELAATSGALSRNLGLATKQASRWASVAQTRDIDTKTMNASFATLTKNVVAVKNAARGTTATFEELGITQGELAAGGSVLAAATRRAAASTTEHRHALVGLGIEQKSLRKSDGALARAMQEGLQSTTGDVSAQQEAFATLGITTKDLEETGGDFNRVIRLVAEGFGKAEGGAERQAAAQTLLGRGYQTLLPLMAEGSKALQKQLELGDQYGATLRKVDVTAQGELAATLRESQRAYQGLQVTVATALTPALGVLNRQFQEAARIMADPALTEDEKFKRIAEILQEDFTKAMDVVVAMIPTFAQHIGEAAPKIAGALVKGFLNADIWGKLFLGGWFISALGGKGAILAIGKRIGLWMAGAMGIEIAAGAAAAGTAGAAGGAARGAATGMFGTAAGAAGAGATAAGGASAAASLAGGAIAVAPALPLVVALKGIDETGLLDAGGPLADTKLGGLLGIHKTTWQVGAAGAMGYAKVLSSVTDELGHLGRAAPRSLEAVTDQAALMTRAGLDGGHLLAKNIESLKFQYGSLREAAKHLSKGQRVAWVNMAFEAEQSGDITRGQLQKMQKAFGTTGTAGRELRRDITGSFHTIADTTHEALQGLANDADRYLNRAADHGIKATGRLKDGAWANVKGLANAVAGGMRNIGGNLNKSLGAVGAKKLPFNIENVDQAVSLAQGGIVVPGSGSGDKVPLRAMVEPGEGVFVLNRNAMGALQGLNEAVPRFQRGGFVDLWGKGMAHLAAGGLVGIGRQLQSQGFLVGEHPAFGGVAPYPAHAAGSYHYSGKAIDVNWPDAASEPAHLGPLYNRLAKVAGLLELFYQNRGIPGPVPDHYDHLHFAMSGGGGMAGGVLGAAVEQIKRVVLEGPVGPLRSLGQKALDKTRKGADAYLAKQAPTGMGTGVPSGVTGAGVLTKEQLRSVMQAAGLPPIFGWIAEAESGRNPMAHNASGASGLWQIMMPLHQGIVGNRNVFDPDVNASVAKVLYGQSGLVPWVESQGGWGSHVGQPYQRGGFVELWGKGMAQLPGGVSPYEFLGHARHGGIAARDGLVHVERGEQMIPPGARREQPVVHVHLHGPGMDELVERVEVVVDHRIDEAEGHHSQLERMHR